MVSIPKKGRCALVLDTETGKVEHHVNPGERPLETFAVDAVGMSPGELLEAANREAAACAEGAIVRVFLNEVDAASYRQVSYEDFRDAVPRALHVQVEPEYAEEALSVQGGAEIGRLEVEWDAFVERQDLAGLERDSVRATGRRFLEAAQGETV